MSDEFYRGDGGEVIELRYLDIPGRELAENGLREIDEVVCGPDGETKHCKYCDKDVDRSNFGVRRASEDGLSYKCKPCTSAYNRLYHQFGRDVTVKQPIVRTPEQIQARKELKKETARRFNERFPDVVKARQAAYRKENPEKRAAATKRWAQANPDKVRATEQRYKANNPEKRRAIVAANYQAHAENRRAYSRQWHAENQEKARTRMAAYAKQHPEIARTNNRLRRARKANAPVCDLKRSQWESIKTAFGGRCVYCGQKPKRLTQDHVLPLALGGSHTASNVVPACGLCNSRKGTGLPLAPVQTVLLA